MMMRGRLFALWVAVLAVAAALVLIFVFVAGDDDDVEDVQTSGLTVSQIADSGDSYLGRSVEVVGEVAAEGRLVEDAAGTTVLTEDGQELLIIARRAQDFPDGVETGDLLRVSGEVRLLDQYENGEGIEGPAGGLGENALPDSILARFEGEPYLYASAVEVAQS